MKTLTRYRLSVLAATVVAMGAWILVGCSKQLTGNETGTPVEVALPALVIEPSQALFFGSTAGNPDGAPTQETSPNSDLFSVQVVDPATTTSTESAPSKASTALSNVWVLQFDGGGTTRACVYVGTVDAGSNILATLESGEGYSVWVVANGPADGSFTTSNPATLSDFESKLLYTGNTTADSQIPLCGKIENVTVLKNGQLLVGNNNATVPSVLLRRNQARVDMILEYDVSGAVFDGAWLYNVPTGACYGLLESAADGFPEAVSGNFSYTEGFDDGAVHAQGTQNANSTYTWYMGDNRRGTNSSILFEVQKHQANAPQYATYIRIKGHEEADRTKYLFHDVYLGKTKTSDFNVLQNWSYTFRVRIGGTLAQQKALTADDPRVSTGVLSIIESATVAPEPSLIPQEGGDYTITIKGIWSGSAEVRVISNDAVLVEGNITFEEAAQGGSTILTIPANESEMRRPIVFQYFRNNSWIAIPSGSGYQKGIQIDAGANFILSKEDASYAMPWTEAIEYCKSLGDGWRLPTHNEGMMMNCMYPVLSASEQFNGPAEFYWSATEYIPNPTTEAWYFDPKGFNVLYPSIAGPHHGNIKTARMSVRCVKSKPADEIRQRYPYVDPEAAAEGKFVIVLQDDNGGFDEAMLFANRVESTVTIDLNKVADDPNAYRISRRFQVRNVTTNAANLAAAKNICDNLVEDGYDNWRVPTMREMMLLWMMGASLHSAEGDINNTGVGDMSVPISSTYLYDDAQFLEFTNGYHFTALLHTKWQAENGGGGTVDFSTGSCSVLNYNNWSLRCVRDDW